MKIILPLLSVLMLGACAGGFLQSTAPKNTIYSLRPADLAPSTTSGKAVVIEIAKPTVPPGFETERIALLMGEGRTLDYFSGATWPDLLDTVMQDFTRRTAGNILPYVVTTAPAQPVHADYRLEVKVNEFQAVYGDNSTSPPRLMVDMEFTLVSLPDERIVRNFSLARSGMAASNNLEAIAAGLESMLQDVQAEAFNKLNTDLRKQ